MTGTNLTICRRCAAFLSTLKPPPPRILHRRTLFTTANLGQQSLLKIAPPDPTAPPQPPPPPIRRDPGLTLGQNGIPVVNSPDGPSAKRKKAGEEKAWAETVFRTLSGGMKSDYLKCLFFSVEVGIDL